MDQVMDEKQQMDEQDKEYELLDDEGRLKDITELSDEELHQLFDEED